MTDSILSRFKLSKSLGKSMRKSVKEIQRKASVKLICIPLCHYVSYWWDYPNWVFSDIWNTLPTNIWMLITRFIFNVITYHWHIIRGILLYQNIQRNYFSMSITILQPIICFIFSSNYYMWHILFLPNYMKYK